MTACWFHKVVGGKVLGGEVEGGEVEGGAVVGGAPGPAPPVDARSQTSDAKGSVVVVGDGGGEVGSELEGGEIDGAGIVGGKVVEGWRCGRGGGVHPERTRQAVAAATASVQREASVQRDEAGTIGYFTSGVPVPFTRPGL